MALKKTDEKPTPPAPEAPDTVLLELELYTNYHLGGTMFVKGQPYRFKKGDALNLLGQTDAGRRIWKMYTPPVKKVVVEKKPVEVSDVPLVDFTSEESQAAGPIHVGTDDEIAEILAEVKKTDDDVTI